MSTTKVLMICAEGMRILLGLVFVYAGGTKIPDPQAFADSIATFKLLPIELLNVVALGLPPFEVVLGLMLVVGFKKRPAALGILMLSCVFAIALAQALVRGLEVDCGCFGSGEPSGFGTWISLGRALLLISLASWLFLRSEPARPVAHA